jgi:hypothetical protein
MKEFTMKNRILASLIGIFLAFFGFWGISVFAAVLGRVPMSQAFPNKMFFLAAICIFQICLFFSFPIQSQFQVLLRVAAVVFGMIFSSEYFMSELFGFNLIPTDAISWWGRLTVLFSFSIGLYLFLNLRKRLHRLGPTEVKSSITTS